MAQYRLIVDLILALLPLVMAHDRLVVDRPGLVVPLRGSRFAVARYHIWLVLGLNIHSNLCPS